MNDDNVLLILTVGGTPRPLAAAIKHWKPKRVLFVPSRDTRQSVESEILPLARKEGLTISAGEYEIYQVSDPQGFAACLDEMQRAVTPEVQRWLKRGDGFSVVVDFTGGTKCMTAALAAAARRWPGKFSYVGGPARNKAGIGVVINGQEQVVQTDNPWNALGFQPVEEAIGLFNARQYAAAAQLLQSSLQRVSDPARKETLIALKLLMQGYDAWDRFQHNDALNTHFRQCERRANNLREAFSGEEAKKQVVEAVLHSQDYLKRLCAESPKPGTLLIRDLVANARRRAEEGRYDDAVARLYRAVEAIAQARLWEGHGLQTGKVPIAKVPEHIRARLSSQADSDGYYKLGLQDAYLLLDWLRDELGGKFRVLGLAATESVLAKRNNSIWAHGFDPVGEDIYHALWNACLALGEINQQELPVFPEFHHL